MPHHDSEREPPAEVDAAADEESARSTTGKVDGSSERALTWSRRDAWRALIQPAGSRVHLTLKAWLALLPPGAVFLAFVLGSAWAPSSAYRSFFEASAQVIPVLLLALAVESRYLRIRRVRPIPPLFWDAKQFLTAMGAGLPAEDEVIWDARIAEFSSSAEGRRFLRLSAFVSGIWKWGSVVQRQVTAVLSAALVVARHGRDPGPARRRGRDRAVRACGEEEEDPESGQPRSSG